MFYSEQEGYKIDPEVCSSKEILSLKIDSKKRKKN